MEEISTYWSWLLRGTGGRPGIFRILNKWIILHLIIGLTVALVVDTSIKNAANTVLLPIAGILIGLCFAWAGNAIALMQSKEISKMSKKHPGGFIEYVYIYQTAILVIFSTIVLWGLAGLGVFDNRLSEAKNPFFYLLIETLLFTSISLTLRECWHVIKSVGLLILAQKGISDRTNSSKG